MSSLALFSVTNTWREAEPLIQEEQQKSFAFRFSICTGLKFGRSYEHHILGSEKEWKLIVHLACPFALVIFSILEASPLK